MVIGVFVGGGQWSLEVVVVVVIVNMSGGGAHRDDYSRNKTKCKGILVIFSYHENLRDVLN